MEKDDPFAIAAGAVTFIVVFSFVMSALLRPKRAYKDWGPDPDESPDSEQRETALRLLRNECVGIHAEERLPDFALPALMDYAETRIDQVASGQMDELDARVWIRARARRLQQLLDRAGAEVAAGGLDARESRRRHAASAPPRASPQVSQSASTARARLRRSSESSPVDPGYGYSAAGDGLRKSPAEPGTWCDPSPAGDSGGSGGGDCGGGGGGGGD